MLLFKKKFLAGDSLRPEDADHPFVEIPPHAAGQRSYIPGIGRIRLTAVDEVELAELTDADARPDGFATAEQLRAEIAQLYPQQLAAGYRAYRIAFALEEENWAKGEG